MAILRLYSMLSCYTLSIIHFGFSFNPRYLVQKNAFNTPSCKKRSLVRISAKEYGRGSEIYPPTNEGSIRLEDSFPNGIIPNSAASLLKKVGSSPLAENLLQDENRIFDPDEETSIETDQIETSEPGESAISEKRVMPSSSYDGDPFQNDSTAPIKFPTCIVLSLILNGLVPVSLLFFTLLFSGYIISLYFIGASTMRITNEGFDFNGDISIDRPIFPALPPQGHVPYLVSNPLGTMLTRSPTYRKWLKLGTIIGVFCPLIATGWYKYRMKNIIIASIVAQNLYLICCQVISEGLSKRAVTPLPIKILLPVAYNTFRIGKLYEWAMLSTKLGIVGRVLAISNLVYWSLNLFGFLIPVATIRYLRSHFFCVEAAEVKFRKGEGRLY